jgi:hypothetical protein
MTGISIESIYILVLAGFVGYEVSGACHRCSTRR